MTRRWIDLTLFGCILLGLNLVARHLQQADDLPWFVAIALAQGAIYLFAVWVVLRDGPAPRSLAVIVIFAALLRLTILFAPPYLSDDIYRYVWDGRVQAAGINPYRFVPADTALRGLRDSAVYEHINRRDYAHTIYPPLAQSIFLGITRVSESVIWVKTCMVGFEVGAIWLLIRLLALLGLPAERVLIYAWHPLTVWEFAGSGHVDAVAIAFLAAALWARQRNFRALTGITLAGATLVKLFPAVLFPVLYRRWDWRMPLGFLLTLAAAYVPYLSVGKGVIGFLPGYVREEGLQTGGSMYLLNVIQHVVGENKVGSTAYLATAALVMLGLVVWLVFRRGAEYGWLQGATILAAVFYLLLSPHYPWYFAWWLLLLAVVPYVPMLYLTIASFILYEALLFENGPVLFRLKTLLYAPFGLLVLVLPLVRIGWRKRYLSGTEVNLGR
jgi:alpha-1,6-mannosyltransferase